MAPKSTLDVQCWLESLQLKEHSNWRWVERFRIASTWSNNWTDGFSKQKLNHVDQVGPYSFPFWGNGVYPWDFPRKVALDLHRWCVLYLPAVGPWLALHGLAPTDPPARPFGGREGRKNMELGSISWILWGNSMAKMGTIMKNPSSHLIKYIELQSSILQSFWGW